MRNAVRNRNRRGLVLLLAAAIDLAAGEPSARLHPVVWLGSAVAFVERRAPRAGRPRQLGYGGALAVGGPAVAALAGVVVERVARRLGPVGLVIEAAALKSAFAVRALLIAGREVEAALDADDLERARAGLRSLVSRETDGLPSSLIAAAAIESLAENATDSVIAPWLAYALLGLPGAFAYRAINTLDSMIGYRGPYEYLGKAAARLDDLANAVPARLAAVLLALAAPIASDSFRTALRTAWRDHGRTASPNAGWTMAAMAGALGVRLEKPGAYILGGGREPVAADIRRAERIVAAAAALAMLGLALPLPRPLPETGRGGASGRLGRSALPARNPLPASGRGQGEG